MWHSLKSLVEQQFLNWQSQQEGLWGNLFSGEKNFLCFPADSTASALKAFQNLSTGNAGAKTPAPNPETGAQAETLRKWMQQVGVPPQGDIQLPEENPLTLEKVDWNKEISAQNLETLRRDSIREAKNQTLAKDKAINQLTQLIALCLQNGNISLAMMLFAHLEARSANQISQTLMVKVQDLQAKKRELADQIAKQKTDAEGSKNITKLRNEMENANDDIGVLQTFIREVTQNKEQSLELANAFMNREHETTMSIIRGH